MPSGFRKAFKKKKPPPPAPATTQAPPKPATPAPAVSNASALAFAKRIHGIPEPSVLVPHRGSVGNAAFTRAVNQYMGSGALGGPAESGEESEGPTTDGSGFTSPPPTPLTVPGESSFDESGEGSEEEAATTSPAVDIPAMLADSNDGPADDSAEQSSAVGSGTVYSPQGTVYTPQGNVSTPQENNSGRYGTAIAEVESESSEDPFSYSSEEEAATAGPTGPVAKFFGSDLKDMEMNKKEAEGSLPFTRKILGSLYDDMFKHSFIPSGESKPDFISNDARVKEGVKRVWGWSDRDWEKFEKLRNKGPSLDYNPKSWHVKYLTTDDERARYAVTPGAVWTNADGKPFDSSRMSSKFGGPGFAIFVMDPHGRVYAGRHKVGLFHHSSFLGGGDVAAAGELKVVKGKLHALSAKSGHYKPGPKHTQNFLRELVIAGVKLKGVRVKIWKGDGVWEYHAQAFLDKGTAAKGQKIVGDY